MALLDRLLPPVADLAAVHARRQLQGFLDAQRDVRRTQEELLRRLIEFSQASQFHRDHSLSSVRTYEEFTRAVPLRDYEALRPYMDEVFDGRSEALFAPGTPVSMFAVTSGTTGKPKHIPVTLPFLDAYRRGWNIWGLMALEAHRSAWLRKIVTVASSSRESLSPSGLPCGAISGLLADTQKWIVRRMYPVPAAAQEIHDASAKLYTILRASIVQDVRMVTTANPSSLIRLAEIGRDLGPLLIRDVHDGTYSPPGEISPELRGHFAFRRNRGMAARLERLQNEHGQLLPRHYWGNLALLGLWTGGTLGLYLPRVQELFGPVPIRDIGLMASEGRLSIPMQDFTPGGVAETTANFLEFIPAGQIESPRPDVLRVHELQQGQEYFLVITNWAGLWRYNIDDRVRCTGFYRQAPIIEFLSKGLHTCSITGEKLTEHQVVHAMAQAGNSLAGLETFELQGCFGDPPFYRLRVEGREGLDVSRVARDLDAALQAINIEYRSKRSSGRLGGVVAVALPQGTFAVLEAQRVSQRGGRGEQYKHKYLLTDVVR